ncbi:MAG: hypothetical protein JWQ14_2547 [Adhaeribacter sp.]|nr:hypothetical protein [Adhaeribacter sp.]
MKKLMLLSLALVSTAMAYGQNILTAYIKDADSQEPLVGATAV